MWDCGRVLTRKHSLDLTPNVQPHVPTVGIIVNIIVSDTMQFAIQLRLKLRLALHCSRNHGDNDKLGARLPADWHGCVNLDADCESGLERWESGHLVCCSLVVC